jgi:hypothetical protein
LTQLFGDISRLVVSLMEDWDDSCDVTEL